MTGYLLGLVTLPILAAIARGLLWVFDTRGVAVCKFDKKEITVWRRLPDWNHKIHFWLHHREYVRASERIAKQIECQNPHFNPRDVTRATVQRMRAECPELLPPAPEPFRIPAPTPVPPITATDRTTP